MSKIAPNLIGIGCAKCGTTSLAKLLASHPEVSAPLKEFHFFDQGNISTSGFANYISNFSPAKWRMDFTPSYIMDRHARFLIKEWLGSDLRFLVILRNPVNRAYSHYCHAKKNWIPGSKWVEEMGYPVERLSFREAIEQELARMVFDPFHARHLSYFSKGLYLQQLNRWFELFKPSQFRFFVLENLVQDNGHGISQLEEAINLSLAGYDLPKLNSQSDSGLTLADYNWLWKKYEPELDSLGSTLGIDISRWYQKPELL